MPPCGLLSRSHVCHPFCQSAWKKATSLIRRSITQYLHHALLCTFDEYGILEGISLGAPRHHPACPCCVHTGQLCKRAQSAGQIFNLILCQPLCTLLVHGRLPIKFYSLQAMHMWSQLASNLTSEQIRRFHGIVIKIKTMMMTIHINAS